MLENVIHFTKSHIVWTLECGCGLTNPPNVGRFLAEELSLVLNAREI